MISLKRKLFPELAPRRIPEVSLVIQNTGAATKRTKKRTKTRTKTAMIQGDSLAAVIIGKQNIEPLKSKRILHQRKDTNFGKSNVETSILMVIDAKENICDNVKEKTRKRTRRQKEPNGDQKCMDRPIGNDKPLSKPMGGVLVCLGANAGFESLSQQIMTKKSRRARSKPTQSKRKIGKKIDAKRVHIEESTSHGDSLMMCTAENPIIKSEKISSGANVNDKPCKQRKKRTTSLNHENRSTLNDSVDVQGIEKTLPCNSKEAVVSSSKIGGLGAFAGITTQGLRRGKSRKERCPPRFVSPLENVLLNSSRDKFKKERKGEKETKIAPDKVPSLIILSQPQKMPKMLRDLLPHNAYPVANDTSIDTNSTSIETIEEDPTPPRAPQPGSKISKVPKMLRDLLPHNAYGNAEDTSLITDEKKRIKLQPEIPSERTSITDSQLNKDTESPKANLSIEISKVDIPETLTTEKISKIQIDGLKGTETKESDEKYRVGTKFQKYFGVHGWFTGEIVSFESETGFYKVRYEDGDVEELEINELEKLTSQSSNRKRSRKSRESRRETEASISVRRSKRRKSEPIRLTPGDPGENKQSTLLSEDKKIERHEQKSRTQAKGSHLQEERNRKVKSDKKSNDNVNPIPSLPSDHNHRKRFFDDALKAIMPIEEKTKRLTKNQVQIEDDIFNSTPMRELFTRNNSNASESDTKYTHEDSDKKVARRSRRKSIEPDRFKPSTDSKPKSSKKLTTKSDPPKDAKSKSLTKHTVKSAMKSRNRTSKSKNKSAAKKRVRISDEFIRDRDFENSEKENEDDQWTDANLKALHRAHRIVDPTSFSFWEDVSELIDDKTAMECRMKWFSLAKTPEPKKPKSKKESKSNVENKENILNVEDDIFNSTPFRSAFAICESVDATSTAFEELGEISNINVGSAIKIHKLQESGSLPPIQDLVSCPHGYKTYLQKMGRVMRQKETRKNHARKHTEHAPLIGKRLAECVDEGDVQVKCRMSPGGTLQVQTFGDTDTEDYLDCDGEEDE